MSRDASVAWLIKKLKLKANASAVAPWSGGGCLLGVDGVWGRGCWILMVQDMPNHTHESVHVVALVVPDHERAG